MLTVPVLETPDRPLHPAFQLAALDLYRDIHKGIRAELFAVTGAAGSLDPAADGDRADLATHVRSVAEVLAMHAAHEDAEIDPTLVLHRPDLAEAVTSDHEALEVRAAEFVALADAVAGAEAGGEQRRLAHRLYLDLASFTGDYLRHQDVEERVVMPALEQAIGFEPVLAIHQAIVGNIPPEAMARSLAFMLPAMNVDDRTELLGGMQAGAPPEVFRRVWSLVGSVLAPAEVTVLGRRLGIA